MMAWDPNDVLWRRCPSDPNGGTHDMVYRFSGKNGQSYGLSEGRCRFCLKSESTLRQEAASSTEPPGRRK